jgi:hypothetical protein
MSPSRHPCIDASERESFGCFSHHPMEERTNTNKGITKKHVKLQYQKDQMLIEIKGYAEPNEHQLKEHMEDDSTNKDEVNPNRKHQ